MGSQSTILLILGAIICLVGIHAGVTMFGASDVNHSRDQIRSEIGNLSREAINYFTRPVNLGGGGKSFENFKGTRHMKISTKKRRNRAGTRLWESETAEYSVLTAAEDSVVIEGIGDHIGNDGKNFIRIRGVIKRNGYYMVDVN